MRISKDLMKLASVLGVLAIGWFTWYSDIWAIAAAAYATGLHAKLAWIVAVSVLAFAAIVLTPFIRNTAIRTLLTILFAISVFAELLSFRIFGDNISVSSLSDMIINRDEAGFALDTYGWSVAASLALAAALFGAFLLRPARSLPIWFAAIPLAAFGAAYFYVRDNVDLLENVPANTAFMPKLVTAFRIIPPSVQYNRYAREAVPDGFEPTEPGIRNVVLIVDESVRSDILQINGYPSDNTPFLASDRSLVNFGTSISIANCSAVTRMALRSMLAEKDFPDPTYRALKKPTFWQYAHKAGYRTVYIDGWLQVRPKHSLLSTDELRHVDSRQAVSLTPFHSSDLRIASRLAQVLKRPGRNFIFVEKIGLHSPYRMNLPPDEPYTRRYVPDPELSETQNRIVREYVEGIHRQVDRFFASLIPQVDLTDTAIIYTSDHGQALFQGGYEATHCTRKNTVRGEGLVPIFLWAPEAWRGPLARSAEQAHDRTMQTDLPATLLRLMGYSAETVRPDFGDGLLAVDPDRKRRFFVGSPFKEELDWVSAD